MQQQDAQRQALMALAQEKEILKAKYFEQKLNGEMFPNAMLTDQWRAVAKIAIENTAPMLVRISIQEFVSVVECLTELTQGEPISFFTFGVLSNCLETKSMNDLGLYEDEYVQFMRKAIELIEFYGKRIKEFRESCDKRAEQDITNKAMALQKNGGLSKVGKA